jgi:divalent metal cation (Fe/Co/Zn/Cd) transporter
MQEAQRATHAAPFRRMGRDEQVRNVSLMQKRKVGQIRSLDWVLNVVERMRVREQNDLARTAFEDVVRAVSRQREKEIRDLSILDEDARELRVGHA